MVKTIAEQLEMLLRLQEVDAEVYRLNREKGLKPAILDRSRQQLSAQKGRLETAEKELREFQVKRKAKEVELETREDQVKKYQVQLYQVKSNKEYTSLQTEIAGLKADNSLLEEEILRLMEEMDQRKGQVDQMKQELDRLTQAYRQEEARIQKEVEALEKEIEQLLQRRQTFTPEVDPKLLSRYERILGGREGLGMVPIDETSCTGCHMQLPPQVINEVRLREKITTCENCSRILYSKD